MAEPVMIQDNNIKKSQKKNLSFRKSTPKLSNEDAYIINTLENLKYDLDYARNCLDNITDDTLIDSYIFEIQSLNMKYEYYLRLCKYKGIVADMM